MKNIYISLILTVIISITYPTISKASGELVVYSARNEQLIKPIFDEYTKATGTSIKFTTDKAGPLLQKLIAEGENSPADILLTVDAGNLWHAANQNLLEVIESDILGKNIPAHLRDINNKWFGMSVRARTIMYNENNISETLTSYEDLASDKWKGKLCLRTSKKVYNQSLVAMLISDHGIEKTEEIVKGWVNNLATAPFSNDTKMIQAVAAGQCEVGIANTYYYGRLIKKDPNIPVKIFWPNQENLGVHVNVSGAAIVKSSKNKKEAIKFIEWLSSKKAQNLFADINMEYPANPAIKPSDIVSKWGDFKPNDTNLSKAGELQIEAVKLMDRAGYK